MTPIPLKVDAILEPAELVAPDNYPYKLSSSLTSIGMNSNK